MAEFLEWWKVSAKNYTCCQRATDDEIRENPEVYDCSQCEIAGRLHGLWRENAEAWNVYRLLSGRSVRELRSGSWLLQKYTDGWPFERITILISRLDLITNALEPIGTAQD